MFEPSAKRFFLYGLTIAALEEFITQGALKDSYFLWIFTVIPFGVFLVVAGGLRVLLHRFAAGWRAAALYYLAAGALGLVVEWCIIGLSPWRDPNAPLTVIVVFHAGVFSFWGTVALAPHLLLDARPEMAKLKRRFTITFSALMGATYIFTFAAKVFGAPRGAQFLGAIGLVILTFLALNVFYIQYFRSCGESAPLLNRGKKGSNHSMVRLIG